MDSNKKINIEENFNKMVTDLLDFYHEKLSEFISDNQKDLTTSDVCVLIMNLCVGAATNIYYSIKKYIPETNLDLDFMRVKMLNEINDHFEKIKNYNPMKKLNLTPEQWDDLTNKGEVDIELENGEIFKANQSNIFIGNANNDMGEKNGHDSKKIISPDNGTLQ